MQTLWELTNSTSSSLAVVATGLIGCATLGGYFSQYAQPLELLSHLRVPYAIALLLLCAFILSLKR